MMRKQGFLIGCSAIAIGVAPGIAYAQANGAGAAIPPATVPQTAGTNPATITDQTPVPGNSDAAEDQKVRNAVDAKEDVVDPMEAGEQKRIQAIHDLRKADGLKAKRSPSDETITVTASRLKQGDPTTRLEIVDAEDIRARGVTSVEDLIRTLPQNVATIGAITNNRTRGPLHDTNMGGSTVSGVGALGVSAANLGGVGAGNTLILINGRRIAGAAGIEQGYANLNGIPLSAIERVEISQGASAVYGADALGGVINFILKKNYVGTTISAQHQFSSGGADNSRVNAYSGYAWGSGSISGTVDYSRRDPIVNRKTGYTTNNYAPLFDGNPAYDKRTFGTGLQPGVIDRPATYDDEGNVLTPEVGLTVPKGFKGAPAATDFQTIGLDSARDYVPKYDGPSSRSVSGTLAFEQNLTSRLRVFANGLYTRTKNSQESSAEQGLNLILGPGQYYNPFAAYEISPFQAGTEVKYYPGAEIADGTLKTSKVSNVTQSWNVSAGASYDITRNAKFELIYTTSESKTTGNSLDVQSAVTGFVTDPNSPTGYSCANDALANGAIPQKQLAAYKAAFERQCKALTSTDPNTAFNPWKSTSNGGGSSIADFLVPVPDQLGTRLQNVEGRLTGSALKLPAGKIDYAVGGEYARTTTSNRLITNVTGSNGPTNRYAFFGEATIPIMGRTFTLPLVKRLAVNAAVRRDVTSTTGAIGTVENIPIDQGGKIIQATNRFARTTPAYGVLWSPISTLDLRAKFTTGFKAPPATQLFTAVGATVYTKTITDDPLYQCTTDCVPGSDGRSYLVPSRVAPNPNLHPETSRQQVFSGSWQPTGMLTGLNLAVTYNRNRIRNQFATIRELYRYLPVADILKLSQFYPRDASGKIISEQNMRYNVIGSNFESLTFEASYLLDTRLGSFQPKITVVDNLVAETIGLRKDFVISQRGRILGVDKYRLVGSLQWNKGPLSANLFVYHTPSYINDYAADYNAGLLSSSELITKVKPLTTVDLSVSYVVLKKLSVQFAGRNILKTDPPFTVVDALPYDTSRYDVAGRTLLLSAQYSF